MLGSGCTGAGAGSRAGEGRNLREARSCVVDRQADGELVPVFMSNVPTWLVSMQSPTIATSAPPKGGPQ
jgi:hypothetical protein